MKEEILENRAAEAQQLTQKLFGMVVEVNPDPHVALTSIMVMSAQLAMGIGLTKDQALAGFNETWNVITNRNKGTMQ
jgi:hypothetical protein